MYTDINLILKSVQCGDRWSKAYNENRFCVISNDFRGVVRRSKARSFAAGEWLIYLVFIYIDCPSTFKQLTLFSKRKNIETIGKRWSKLHTYFHPKYIGRSMIRKQQALTSSCNNLFCLSLTLTLFSLSTYIFKYYPLNFRYNIFLIIDWKKRII